MPIAFNREAGMTIPTISLKRARRIALDAGLLRGNKIRAGQKRGVYQTIKHLGYIQIDTISVVERAHHHTLWNRRHDYVSSYLDELQSKDRKVFEYWGHEASYLPMADYRFYLAHMESFKTRKNRWIEEKRSTCRHLMKKVLNRIRSEGPLASRDFKPEPGKKRNGWWDWKPAKNALELLFWEGRLMITRRDNFQRVYDLTRRVLPAEVNTSPPSREDTGRFYVIRALKGLGIATKREMADYLRTVEPGTVSKATDRMVSAGELMKIAIKSLEKYHYFIRTEDFDRLTSLRKIKTPLRFLSPFDPLVINRDRTLRLFGFDYKLECYTPRPKRQYGYFSLPVLWDEQLVGRMDAKADRRSQTFGINTLVLEPGFRETGRIMPDLLSGLKAYIRFNGCTWEGEEKMRAVLTL